MGVARTEAPAVDGEESNCEDAESEIAVADATMTTGDDMYAKLLMEDNSVGEDAIRDEEMAVLLRMLDVVEFVMSAAVSAATTDGSMVATEPDAENAAATLTATSSAPGEAKGYAGTVKVLGNGGTEGTEGKATLGTAGTDGTDGTDGRPGSEATIGAAGTAGSGGCDGSDRIRGTVGWVSAGRDAVDGTAGRDAIDGTCSVDAASSAAATGTETSGVAIGAETLAASVTGSTGMASVGAAESGCVTVVWATTFPVESTVATTSTLTVLTLVPAS